MKSKVYAIKTEEGWLTGLDFDENKVVGFTLTRFPEDDIHYNKIIPLYSKLYARKIRKELKSIRRYNIKYKIVRIDNGVLGNKE